MERGNNNTSREPDSTSKSFSLSILTSLTMITPTPMSDGNCNEVEYNGFSYENCGEENGSSISKTEVCSNDPIPAAKPLKEKTSKAERRALQEAQRAAKASKKVDASGVVNKQDSQKKNASLGVLPVAVSEITGNDQSAEKERKKGNPSPHMQYDDKSSVDKAKKQSVVEQIEAKNRVEFFRHLPQYEHKNKLSDLESNFFKFDQVHPAVFKVGLEQLAGNITGSNARCIAILYAFKEAIGDYHNSPQEALNRDFSARISTYISYLKECSPLSIGMGNAIRRLKTSIAMLPINLTESEAKSVLSSQIDRYVTENIIFANTTVVNKAATKIRDGDVLLTHGCSSVVEMVLEYAHELGKKFRVIIIDSRPNLDGQGLLRRMVAKGLRCTYTHINAVSHVMHEVTSVFLGATSIFSNGTVYSRVGTACVAMVAHSFRVPVLVCCEAYKFHERAQLDSICMNELGDPDAITKVHGRKDVNYLENWTSKENLRLLNIQYDVTPSDYVSMIVTDYGMVPPTSIPVILREYRKRHLF